MRLPSLLLVLIFSSVSSEALAFNQAQTAQRVKGRWFAGSIPLVIRPTSSDLSAGDSSTAIGNSIQEWNAHSPVQIVPSASGLSTLSYSSDSRYFGPGVVAVTSLNFNQVSGKIVSGDVRLNESLGRTHCFTNNPAGGSCSSGLNPIFVGDVVSHELGHLLGLAHSEVRDSTMFYSAERGQQSLHADDIAGVRTIYGVQDPGSISGVVRGGNQIPIFGAHVQAISSRTGVVLGAALSDEKGLFSIPGLANDDTYYLYVAPTVLASTLPDPYYSVKKNFCPGDYVGSFFEQCGTTGKGHPQPLRLTSANPSIDVGTVTIRCQLRLAEEYLVTKAQLLGGEQDFVATTAKKGQSFAGHYPAAIAMASSFSAASDQDDVIKVDLSNVPVPGSGPRLDFRLLTSALGSPLDFSITIDGPSGTVVDPDRILFGGYGEPNYDVTTLQPLYDRHISYALSSNPALNLITITLRPRALRSDELLTAFPGNPLFQVGDRPWLAWVGVSNSLGVVYENTASPVADNLSCLDAPYSYAVKPNPVSAASLNAAINGSSLSGSSKAGPACGTIDAGGDGPAGGAGGMMVGFTLSFLLIRRRTRGKARLAA